MKYRRYSAAFTLIELLMVIAIIGILVVISLVSVTNAQKRSRDVQRKNALLTTQSSLEQYRSAHNAYAPEYCSVAKSGGSTFCTNTGDGLYWGGLGYADYMAADQKGEDGPDPLFAISSYAPYQPYTGYLLPYMAALRTPSATLNVTGTANDPVTYPRKLIDNEVQAPVIAVKTTRMGYIVTKWGYWLRIALESTSEPRVPAPAGTCYYNDASINGNPPGNAGSLSFHDAVYSAFHYTNGTSCDNQLKMYTRGNLGTVSQ